MFVEYIISIFVTLVYISRSSVVIGAIDKTGLKLEHQFNREIKVKPPWFNERPAALELITNH